MVVKKVMLSSAQSVWHFPSPLLMMALLLKEACNPGSMYIKELRSMKEGEAIKTVLRLTF